MSTDWGIGCRTCREAGADRSVYFTGEWDNCRDTDGLWRLIVARNEIVAVAGILGGQARFLWNHGSDAT